MSHDSRGEEEREEGQKHSVVGYNRAYVCGGNLVRSCRSLVSVIAISFYASDLKC